MALRFGKGDSFEAKAAWWIGLLVFHGEAEHPLKALLTVGTNSLAAELQGILQGTLLEAGVAKVFAVHVWLYS